MLLHDTKSREQGRRSVLIIAGPTASGKSAMAMDVAEQYSGTVINADSMQVYKELREVTARPSVADEKRVPHRLFGVLSGAESCSAGHWTELAVGEIKTCFDTGQLPVLVGGTGMYLKSLVEGLSPIPDIDAKYRDQATALHKTLGADAFKAEVAKLDPESAQRLPAGDTQRLIRAWEVSSATGRAFSAWQNEPRIQPLPGVNFAHIALVPPRELLYAAIDARFSRMVEGGALAEVRDLMSLDLDPALPLMKALGVSELIAHLNGDMSLDDAVAKAQQVSRNYAKRQLTWVRSQLPDAHVLTAQYSQSFRQEIFSFVQQFWLTERA
ncbi:MAG: tRNA (adenosine(37)-N6)-dimethylallyltransferase MiaA [Magnetovibrio sp.]|nr:tRNA (adenosine(37)-N6)-dimethylallyltransferase MiaA [Magnetovibrio sp.]